MRLLNTSTRRLEEFFGSKIPVYAILSHRWESEEVTFQDLANGAEPNNLGWAKIEGCCCQAASNNIQWVWIDSCCIDKTSSAELSEAINSMFRWYRYAKVCYVYLSDVPTIQGTTWKHYSPFRSSRWFTRGWTLQELLAPRDVEFYDQDWVKIGTKGTLDAHISFSTGIQNIASFEEASVAQKMSWASKRETTREEDTAYCLMGLFGVNMPALYGEGPNAFRRLQLAILEQSDDESIFAWKWPTLLDHSGLLAPSPLAFEESGNIEKLAFDETRKPYSMTNKGLKINLRLFKGYDPPRAKPDRFCALLNCTRSHNDKSDLYPLAIWLRHIGRGQYIRVSQEELLTFRWTDQHARASVKETVYVKQPETLDPLSLSRRLERL